MSKENVLFAVIGLLFGMMIGFFFANSVNQGAVTPASSAMQTQPGMPSGHPSVPGSGGSVAEVQAAIDRAKSNPNDFEAQMKAAELYYQIQRFDSAIEFLKNANTLQPENFEVIVNLGNAHFDAGKYDEAEKWYLSALSKKPDNLDVRTDLGLSFVFREKPDNDRAIAEFNKVLEANPAHVQALQNLAVAYTKKKDAAKAEEALTRLEKADPSNATIAKLRDDIAALK